METNVIHVGDCLETLRTFPDQCVNCCVTSPPYWGLRDYGCPGQIGLEETSDEYVQKMTRLFREVHRVLKDDGTLWLNLGDTYGDDKQLVGIPWRVVLSLQADGWRLRQDIIWSKPNPMPEPVTDRFTKAHEYVFLLTKSARYYFDNQAVKEKASGRSCGNRNQDQSGGVTGGFYEHRIRNFSASADKKYTTRNRRSVWTVASQSCPGAHFAVMPTGLAEVCVRAGCPEGGTVLDPFMGSGTVAVVAAAEGRKYIGCELNPEYFQIAKDRLKQKRLF